MQRFAIGSGHLVIREGDITTLDVDCIVNAANSSLAGGGGVDGAIHRAAGLADLQRACRAIIDEIGALPPGRAVITSGFGLAARHIIHTVGPIWRGGHAREPELLRDCYDNSLGLACIAFPAISCGVYGYPVAEAARIALAALRRGLMDGLVTEAAMVLHGQAAYTIWTQTAHAVL
jgi:O-acetyl-ADP-ribose deacetylase (regulator of RNase III)